MYRNAPGTIYAANASIQAFLEFDYTQFSSAIEFLYPEALFSTEHGVKGEEYDNVIFVISRGWNMYQFETYAPMITGKASIPSGKQISFERNRNLFYVCCSRPVSYTHLDEFFEVQEMDFDGLLNKIEKYY